MKKFEVKIKSSRGWDVYLVKADSVEYALQNLEAWVLRAYFNGDVEVREVGV